MMDDIRQWLDAGAEVHEGLRLLNIYAPNKFLVRLVSMRPERYRPLLVRNLSALLPAEEKAKMVPQGMAVFARYQLSSRIKGACCRQNYSLSQLCDGTCATVRVYDPWRML